MTSKHILKLCTEAKALRVTIPERVSFPDSSAEAVFIFNRVRTLADALPVPASDSEEKEVQVFVKSIIRESDHSTVFLAHLRGVPVVLKCCYNVEYYKDFKQEAKIYEARLGDLQGSIVPTFFGYYRAVDKKYGPYSLLLLEHCGERITREFRALDIKVRYVCCSLTLSR